MRRATHRRWLWFSHLFVIGGLGLALVWNIASLFFDSTKTIGWVSLIFPLPGILAWTGALIAPRLLRRQRPMFAYHYRLLYETPTGWRDDRARTALLNLIRSGTGLAITWAREGDGVGCWLSVGAESDVLARLVRDVFPGGLIEADMPPLPEEGVIILQWQLKDTARMPGPAELCRREGLAGLHFIWHSDRTATVVVWGAQAQTVAQTLAQPAALLVTRGQSFWQLPYLGDNPWPDLPPFPSSQDNPALAALSRLERLAPALRVTDAGRAVVLGYDAEAQPVGFAWPELRGLNPLAVYGHLAERVVVNLAGQAIRAGLPVAFVDGHGTATAILARHLLRETATGQVLMCDVERPTHSRLRLNPLWLPGDQRTWPAVLTTGWLAWLRELGVTPAGLGRVAFQHTQVAVMLTALLAAQKGLMLDLPTLHEALAAPDFLTIGSDALAADPSLFDPDLWQWWLAEGRATPNFDVHLRLGHLRDRLRTLLALPHYRLLWQPPYLDPLTTLTGGAALFWRLPDPHRHLRVYLTSQLLALTTVLTAWPAAQPPLLIFLHEVPDDAWANQLQAFSAARLVQSSRRVPARLPLSEAASLLLSRLERAEAEQIRTTWPDLPAADLRRLPPSRLLLRRGTALATLDIRT